LHELARRIEAPEEVLPGSLKQGQKEGKDVLDVSEPDEAAGIYGQGGRAKRAREAASRLVDSSSKDVMNCFVLGKDMHQPWSCRVRSRAT